MPNSYELLGISPDATVAELRAAYQAKQALYAADRLAHLAPEFQQQAAQRRAEFAQAYRVLRPALAAARRLPEPAERRRERETIVALSILFALAVLIPMLRSIAVPPRSVAVEGSKAALLTAETALDFTLESLDGTQVSLSDFKGKVIVLNFWATWCPPCVREIPRLIDIQEKYRDQGVVVLGVNTTFQDTLAQVAPFVENQGINYPVLLDTEASVAQKYPTRLMPTTYLIDRNGKIAHTKVGEVDEATLDGQIAALLQPVLLGP